jgi:hemerythrin-like domain-containing protein
MPSTALSAAIAEPLHQHHHLAPLTGFTKTHMRFVAALHAALELPRLVESAARARAMAVDLVNMFEHGVMAHHMDEEIDLFPVVQRCAFPGEERHKVESMVAQLVREHRELNALWLRLEPSVREVGAGATPPIDNDLLEDLVGHFFAHAHFEEEYFLPVAEEILRRDSKQLAALGVALHARHKNW